MYTGIHTPALFGFMAAACVYAPERYVRLRTIFVVSFLPALLAIGLYPLAPPHWISELGFGPAPEQGELAGSIDTLIHNSTAAIASQHFGFAAFIAAAASLARSPLAHRLGRGGVPRPGVRRHRRNRQPLRPRLHRRRAHVHVRDCGRLALLHGRSQSPPRCARRHARYSASPWASP